MKYIVNNIENIKLTIKTPERRLVLAGHLRMADSNLYTTGLFFIETMYRLIKERFIQ